MYEYKILKIGQPFVSNGQNNDYDDFQTNLLNYLNSGYELVHSENVSYNYYDIESHGKLFILRKPR